MSEKPKANFTPEQNEYKNLTSFQLFTLTNFPFLADDFDRMTNEELLYKIVEYVNNVIANEQSVTENTQNLYNAYVNLQNFINDYFNNLDVQENINIKLDELARNRNIVQFNASILRKYTR